MFNEEKIAQIATRLLSLDALTYIYIHTIMQLENADYYIGLRRNNADRFPPICMPKTTP